MSKKIVVIEKPNSVGNRSTYTKEHFEAWLKAGKPSNDSRNWKKFKHMSEQSNGKWIDISNGLEMVLIEDVDAVLKKLYFNTETGYTGAIRLYDQTKQRYTGITRKLVFEFLRKNSVHQQHHSTLPKRTFKPIVSKAINNIWQVDLIDMAAISSFNNRHNFAMVIIDLFSKYAWVRPMRNKTSDTTRDTIKDIIDTNGTKPKAIQSDNGLEFTSKFDQYLKSQSIKHIFSSSHTPQSQGAVERLNKTLKGFLYRYMTANNTKRWYNVFDEIATSYNSSIHTTTRKRPDELYNTKDDTEIEETREKLREKADKSIFKHKLKPLLPDDWVRIALETYAAIRIQQFRKSFKRTFSRELYQVVKSKGKIGVEQYKIKDVNNQVVKGWFHRSRLLPSVSPDQVIKPPLPQAKSKIDERGLEELTDEEKKLSMADIELHKEVRIDQPIARRTRGGKAEESSNIVDRVKARKR
jgi:transposase InsO family protein